jgi:hypothetical protein
MGGIPKNNNPSSFGLAPAPGEDAYRALAPGQKGWGSRSPGGPRQRSPESYSAVWPKNEEPPDDATDEQ